jgi:hypothetical protein
MKWVLRCESPRDYGDLLLSMAYPPLILICDMPYMVASHVSKLDIGFKFARKEGRLAEATAENIRKAHIAANQNGDIS